MKRRMILLVTLIVIVMLALAACGGNDDNGDDETSGGDDTTGDITTGGESGNGPVDFTITGDPPVERTVTGANAATDVTNETVSLLFFVSMSDLVVSIDNIPYMQEPDTFAIGGGLTLEQEVTAEVVNGAANFTRYASTEGVLDITEWNNDTMSGTFEFTAEKQVNEDETPATITVSGTFTGIPAPHPVE